MFCERLQTPDSTWPNPSLILSLRKGNTPFGSLLPATTPKGTWILWATPPACQSAVPRFVICMSNGKTPTIWSPYCTSENCVKQLLRILTYCGHLVTSGRGIGIECNDGTKPGPRQGVHVTFAERRLTHRCSSNYHHLALQAGAFSMNGDAQLLLAWCLQMVYTS